MEPISIGNWNSHASAKVMSIEADVLVHVNVTLPNGVEEVALKMLLKDLRANLTLKIDGMVIRAHVESATVSEV